MEMQTRLHELVSNESGAVRDSLAQVELESRSFSADSSCSRFSAGGGWSATVPGVATTSDVSMNRRKAYVVFA